MILYSTLYVKRFYMFKNKLYYDEPYMRYICYTHIQQLINNMSYKTEIHFDNEQQAAMFLRWMSTVGEQSYGDFQDTETNSVIMPTYDNVRSSYVDYRTTYNWPNNDSIFEHLEGDELIQAMSEGTVEQDD